MEMINCSVCGFLMPESYDSCPCCVYGIEPNKMGRVHCRACQTLVGEHRIMPGGDYHEFIQKCDYCDPSSNATDLDIVEKFHFWSFSPDKKPNHVLVQRTRAERRINVESDRKFREQLNLLLKEVEENVE